MPVCAVAWSPFGGNRSELWVRCATPDIATDVRVGFWWRNAWDMTFATDHTATERFAASANSVEWKVGSVDFGSNKPFDGTDTPIDVMIDGQWLPAAVETFERRTPLTEPATRADGPGISELRVLQARVTEISADCPEVPDNATSVKVTIDVARRTCTIEGTSEVCVGIEFFCDHRDTLIALIGATAVTALAVPLIPAIAAGLTSGAATLSAVWHGLAGSTITIGAGAMVTTSGNAISAAAAITITSQHLVVAGGALTIANIGTYLATEASGRGDDKGDPAPSPNFVEPTNSPQLPPTDLHPGHSIREMGPTPSIPTATGSRPTPWVSPSTR